jgi:glycosyltransferase involved in cell wall biosynthesis
MSIIHLASELGGGAGLAALRLHRALRELGEDSHLLSGTGATAVPGWQRFSPSGSTISRYLDRIFDQFVWNFRRADAGLFTRTRRFLRGGLREALAGADIVHLHWVAKWLDMPSLFDAIPKNAKIVLTLHDASFFAGGCHQTDECRRYEQACGSCPKLRFSGKRDLSASGYKLRQKAYQGRKIVAVPNSKWMEKHAASASLLKDIPLHDPIYPGIDTTLFQPLDRRVCRDILGVPQERFVICAGAADLGDASKGMPLLLEALAALPSAIREKTAMLTYGSGALQGEIAGIPVYQTGFVASERLLAVLYSAADVYCTPSRMETFGMTAAEAGACGIPVIAFATGGLPEIVKDGVNGWLVPLGSVAELTVTLIDAAQKPERCQAMGVAGRKLAKDTFDIRAAAEDYTLLYNNRDPV